MQFRTERQVIHWVKLSAAEEEGSENGLLGAVRGSPLCRAARPLQAALRPRPGRAAPEVADAAGRAGTEPGGLGPPDLSSISAELQAPGRRKPGREI